MRAFFLTLLLFSPGVALAQTAPLPGHHPVKEIEQKLKEEQATRESLAKETTSQKKNIKDLQASLVGLAQDITANEQKLDELEGRLEKLHTERGQIEARLGDDQGAIADLILALQRIQRVPPEALLAKPGAPLQTAQSAMLLETILPSLYGRAEGLKSDLARLAEIIAATEEDKKDYENQQLALENRQKEMAGLLDERQTLYKQAQTNLAETERTIHAISTKAGNLKDLISRLDERRRQENAARAEKASLATPPPRADTMPRAGSGQLPVSGIVRTRYGDRDEIGAKSEGVRIEARSGALVVAPMGGIVRYSGDFRNYGSMVIIEHKNGYHSLVAGLAKIDTVVGQSVAAGEPLGMLGDQGTNKPSLYYELRLDGQPINPARKIGDLG